MSHSEAYPLPTASYVSLNLRRWLKAMSLRAKCCAKEPGLYSLMNRNTHTVPSALNLRASSRNFWAGGKPHWFPSVCIYIPPKGIQGANQPFLSFFYANSAAGLPAPEAPAMLHTTERSKPGI